MFPYIVLLRQSDSVPFPPFLRLSPIGTCRLRGVGLGVVLLVCTVLITRWDDCHLLGAPAAGSACEPSGVDVRVCVVVFTSNSPYGGNLLLL